MTQALEHHRFRPWSDLRSRAALDDSGPRRWNEEAILSGSECRVRLEVDPFDDRMPAGYRAALLDLMKATPQISWIVTTEFPDAVRELAGDFVEDWPSNVWLGVRVSRQSDADKDVPALLELPVPVRFADCSPLTGPVDLRWVFERRADLEAVVRIELPPRVAERALAGHPGLSVDYAANLWWRRY